jgi:hypothetical protein
MNDLDFFELQPYEKMLKRLDVVFEILSDKSCEYSCFCLLSSVIACLHALLIHANLFICTLPFCLFVFLSACMAARPPFWAGNSEYGELAKKESYDITLSIIGFIKSFCCPARVRKMPSMSILLTKVIGTISRDWTGPDYDWC